MPSYTYVCDKCNKSFSVFATIREYQEQEYCIDCNVLCSRNYEDMLTLNSSVKKSDSELKTIGDLANRNRDRMTDDRKSDLYEKHNSYKDEADKKPMPTGMSRMKKPKQKFKWR